MKYSMCNYLGREKANRFEPTLNKFNYRTLTIKIIHVCRSGYHSERQVRLFEALSHQSPFRVCETVRCDNSLEPDRRVPGAPERPKKMAS
jgi:hypothetical protein